MLERLHQHKPHVVRAFLLPAAQPQVLHLESGSAVLGRYDAAVESDGVGLLLDLGLQRREAGFDLLVGLAIDVPVRFEQRDFLLERHDLRLEPRDLVFVGLPLARRIHDVVIGLDAAEFVHEVADHDDECEQRQARGHHAATAVQL